MGPEGPPGYIGEPGDFGEFGAGGEKGYRVSSFGLHVATGLTGSFCRVTMVKRDTQEPLEFPVSLAKKVLVDRAA